MRQLREQLVPSVVFPIELRLTALETKMLSFLLARSPHPVTKEQVLEAVYTDPDDAPDVKTIDVKIRHLRKKLAPFGVDVRAHWGVGYSIDRGHAAVARDWLAGAEALRVAVPLPPHRTEKQALALERKREEGLARRIAASPVAPLALPAPSIAAPVSAAPSALQIRTIRGFASAGQAATFIAKQVDLPLPVVKAVLKGDLR